MTPDSLIYRDWLQQVTSGFIHAGFSAIKAANRSTPITLEEVESVLSALTPATKNLPQYLIKNGFWLSNKSDFTTKAGAYDAQS